MSKVESVSVLFKMMSAMTTMGMTNSSDGVMSVDLTPMVAIVYTSKESDKYFEFDCHRYDKRDGCELIRKN